MRTCVRVSSGYRFESAQREQCWYSKAPSVVEHSGPFPEISHRFLLLCGREEVNGSESTPAEKEGTMDP